jgi:hypothetical protein
LLSVIRKLSAVSFTVKHTHTHTHFLTTTSNLFKLLPPSTRLHSISFLQTTAKRKRNCTRAVRSKKIRKVTQNKKSLSQERDRYSDARDLRVVYYSKGAEMI